MSGIHVDCTDQWPVGAESAQASLHQVHHEFCFRL